jgi:hypothetical protein
MDLKDRREREIWEKKYRLFIGIAHRIVLSHGFTCNYHSTVRYFYRTSQGYISPHL